MSRHVQSSSASAHGGHYAVSSHVSNGNLLVDNGATGVIQTGSHGVYEENLSKFKGIAQFFTFFETKVAKSSQF